MSLRSNSEMLLARSQVAAAATTAKSLHGRSHCAMGTNLPSISTFRIRWKRKRAFKPFLLRSTASNKRSAASEPTARSPVSIAKPQMGLR